MSIRAKAYLYLSATTVIWGVAAVVIKTTLDYLPPFSFLFYRYLINIAVFLPFFLVWLHKENFKLTDVKKLIFWGLLQSASLILIFVGFDLTTAAEGAFLSSLSPIFIVMGSGLILKEVITRQEKIGFFITVVGATIIMVEPLLGINYSQIGQHLIGNGLTFLFSLVYAGIFIFSKEIINRKHQPIEMVFYMIITGVVMFWPLAAWEQFSLQSQSLPQVNLLESMILGFNFLAKLITNLPPAAWFGLIYMSIFSTLIANWTSNHGLKLIEASEAAPFTYLQPIVAVVLAWIVLSENINLYFIVGAVITLIGLYVTEKRPPLPK